MPRLHAQWSPLKVSALQVARDRTEDCVIRPLAGNKDCPSHSCLINILRGDREYVRSWVQTFASALHLLC